MMQHAYYQLSTSMAKKHFKIKVIVVTGIIFLKSSLTKKNEFASFPQHFVHVNNRQGGLHSIMAANHDRLLFWGAFTGKLA
jgi:hypothetical protein